jgi:prophage regulatory protein
MTSEHYNIRSESAVTDRIIGEPECQRLTDLSRTSRWRLMRRNQFPNKIKLSPNRTGWRLSAVMDWVIQREAA